MGIGHFVGMRWVEWAGGPNLPEDILEEVLYFLDKALSVPSAEAEVLAQGEEPVRPTDTPSL